MDERKLDRAIDTVAEGMMAREPGRTLSFEVMTRVRGETRSAPARFVWITAAATFVLLCALAIVLLNRGPAAVVPAPPSASPPPPLAAAQPLVIAVAPVPAVQEIAPRLRTIKVGASTARGVASTVQVPPNDDSAIEPIEMQPIVLSTIELPQLEREMTLIDTINVEALTIEPLTASND